MFDSYQFTLGQQPLLVSIPHAGTKLTQEVEQGLSAQGRMLADTDWHVPKLYDFLESMGANILQAYYSRYVVDLNRPSDDKPLYNTATTGLFSEIQFDGEPLFDTLPSSAHRRYCLNQIWWPYHQKIRYELNRLHEKFGYALLLDAHSIRSRVPRLFKGRLPDLNLGTNAETSCSPHLNNRLEAVCRRTTQFSHIMNGRFKGGYITRQYGNPEQGYHAVQLELAQCNYMEEFPSYDYHPAKAETLKPVLRELIENMIHWGKKTYQV